MTPERPVATAPTVVYGIKPWKRWQLHPFRAWLGEPLRFRARGPRAGDLADRGARLACWASREPDDFAAAARDAGVGVLRVEDGFLRSVGLGANHRGGASLVIDAQGIYFDARSPSTLETLLQSADFDDALCRRARRLRAALVRDGLSKYNVGGVAPTLGGAGRRRLLVVGQVEGDASLRFGSPRLRGNLDLLRAVRAAEPGAWIAYKPHPDCEAGARAGTLADAEVLASADQLVRGAPITALFAQVDALHTLTSLAGFEALLRGVPVVTWGQPFYMGWGLTDDRCPLPRRTRRRTLDELVAAALILYPRYVDPATGAPCEVERVVEHLARAGTADPRHERANWRRKLRLLQGWARSLRL